MTTFANPPPDKCPVAGCNGLVDQISHSLAYCRGEAEHSLVYREEKWWLDTDYKLMTEKRKVAHAAATE